MSTSSTALPMPHLRSLRRLVRCRNLRCPRATSGIVSDVLLDTDVVIDHLRGARRLAIADGLTSYSVVTRAELFAGRAKEEGAIAQLLGPFRELPVDRAIAECAGRLRRDHGVRIADALIAATALMHGLALVTRNFRDFEHVPRLRLRPPAG